MEGPLFKVEDCFEIRGRGPVIVGFRLGQHALFKAGDVLVIDRPDGSTIEAVIQGIEPPVGAVYSHDPPPPSERRYGLLIDTDAVPIGSVVRATRSARDNSGSK
jgi:hypothetical protein